MPKIKLIVYDFDGTLFDTRFDIAQSVNLSLMELGLPKHPPEAIYEFIGNGVVSLMKRAIGTSRLRDVDLDLAVETFRKIYAENLVVETVPYPNCFETIDGFVDKKQSIHSNKPEHFVREILNRFDFSHPFQTIIGGDTLETRKPNPEGLLYILTQAGVSPENTLMVGDSVIDIETAKHAGVRSCGVTYGIGGSEAIAEADYIINSISELPKVVL